MSEQVSQDIIDRIKKVKALADQGEAGEMENAAAMLSRLLVKYNLSMSQIEDHGNDGMVDTMVYTEAAGPTNWRSELVAMLADHHFCRVIYQKLGGSYQWIVIGRKHNQESVLSMYEYLEEEINRRGATELIKAKVEPNNIEVRSFSSAYASTYEYLLSQDEANKAWDSWDLANTDPRRWANSWRLGAVRGIGDRLDAERTAMQEENQAEWSIAPFPNQEVEDFINENFTIDPSEERILKAERSIYNLGRVAGRSIGVREVEG